MDYPIEINITLRDITPNPIIRKKVVQYLNQELRILISQDMVKAVYGLDNWKKSYQGNINIRIYDRTANQKKAK